MANILFALKDRKAGSEFSSAIKSMRPREKIYVTDSGNEIFRLIVTKSIDILIIGNDMDGIDIDELNFAVDNLNKAVKIIAVKSISTDKSKVDSIIDKIMNVLESQKDFQQTCNGAFEPDGSHSAAISHFPESEMKHQLTNIMPIYLQHRINKWVNGDASKAELTDIENLLESGHSGIVIVAEILHFNDLKLRFQNDEIHNIRFFIYSTFVNALSDLGFPISCYLENQKNILITILNFYGDKLRSVDCLKALNLTSWKIKQEYEIDIKMGVSPLSVNILKDIRNCYSNAMLALSYIFYMPSNTIMLYDDIEDFISTPFRENVVGKEITAAVSRLEKEKIQEILAKRVFNFAASYPNPKKLIDSINNLITFIVMNLIKEIGEEKSSYILTESKEKLETCNDIIMLKQQVNEIFRIIMLCIVETNEVQSEQVLKKCIQYIEANYMSDISLDLVASLFHYNTSYFSTLFRSFTGVTFSEYLRNVRLMKSKELLISTDKRVYEIAEICGYNDAKYFSKVFKSQYGILPEDFRRRQMIMKSV